MRFSLEEQVVEKIFRQVQDEICSNVIQGIEETVIAFVREIVLEVFLSTAKFKSNFNGQSKDVVAILPFGSYPLEVCTNSSDLDLLVVYSSLFSEESFLDGMKSHFASVETSERIGNVSWVLNAYVPLLKFEVVYDNFVLPVDVVFSQANVPIITGFVINMMDNNAVLGLSKKSMLALNGYRAAHWIKSSLGERKQLFRKALLLIKYWAKKRFIYSKKLGLLGGINLSIMLFKVISMFPQAKLPDLLFRFFEYTAMFAWDKEIIALTEITPLEDPWELRWLDNDAPMIVLTPVFPEMNSLHNTIKSTARIISQEFFLAYKDVKNRNEKSWISLFSTQPSFFGKVDSVVMLFPTVRNEEYRDECRSWAESVLHKTRNLLKELEKLDYVWPRPYPAVVPVHSGYVILVGIELSPSKAEQYSHTPILVDIEPSVSWFISTLAGSSDTKWYFDIDVRVAEKHMMFSAYSAIAKEMEICL